LASHKNQPDNKVTGKRSDYLSWDEYFIAVALLSAQRSKDPSTQVGACIVNPEHKIVGVGYNGFPIGCSDDDLPWSREGAPLETKYPYVCHAELNAVLNSIPGSLKDCTIYTALFPCNECAKVIIQAGIKTVVYLSDKYAATDAVRASKIMFDQVGVTYRQLDTRRKTIEVCLDY
jgi:dCMP deaminase